MELFIEIMRFVCICGWAIWSIHISNKVSALTMALELQTTFDDAVIKKVAQLETDIHNIEENLENM